MAKKIVIFPAAGNGLEALSAIDATKYEVVAFIDDDEQKQQQTICNIPVKSRDFLNQYPELGILAVVGNPSSFKQRATIIKQLNTQAERWVSVVAPNSYISPFATIGHNTLIMPYASLMPQAEVGNHVVILPHAVIHHEAKIADYTWVGSHCVVAGGVQIGENCWIGSQSVLLQNISLAPKTLIGIGSTLLKSIDEPEQIWAGNPAKNIKI